MPKTKRPGPFKKALLPSIYLAVIAVLLVIVLVLLPDAWPAEASVAAGNNTPTENTQSNSTASVETPPENPANSNASASSGIVDGSENVESSYTSDVHDGGSVTAASLPDPKADFKGYLVFLIDDVGYKSEQIALYRKIPVTMNYAVIPGLSYSTYGARELAFGGNNIILHQPMETLGGAELEAGGLYTSMTSAQISDTLNANLNSLPNLAGINNHMGSKATQDPLLMTAVLQELKKRNMFFIDSRTSPDSVAYSMAQEMGVPSLERNVFLDNEQNREAILEALEKGKEIAEKRGYAVMIGHAWCEELAEVILDMYPQLLDEGFEFASLNHVIGLLGEM